MVFLPVPDCSQDVLRKQFLNFQVQEAFKAGGKVRADALAAAKGLEILDVKDNAQYTADVAREKIRDKAKPNGPAIAVRAAYRDPSRGQRCQIWLIGAKFASGLTGDTGAGI
jgi:hypothetical protein